MVKYSVGTYDKFQNVDFGVAQKEGLRLIATGKKAEVTRDGEKCRMWNHAPAPKEDTASPEKEVKKFVGLYRQHFSKKNLLLLVEKKRNA